ncbi:MAG: hypothetical protein JSW50_03990, partial [Candidatus Latescibacterota bacterium]
DVLDLSELGTHLVVHGTIVVAEGNPHGWPQKSFGAMGTIDRFPTRGTLVLTGAQRMHFTQTYRSSDDGASYLRYRRTLRTGRDEQMIPFPAPDRGRPLREFPGLLAASRIEIGPRAVGFARYRADIGEERLTIVQGILFAGDAVDIDGRGGWTGEPVVFDEETSWAEDDSFDESIFDIDLNDDGDRFDIVQTIDITTCPIIPISPGHVNIDINNDGILGRIVIGTSYAEFFDANGYALPVLFYHEGLIMSERIGVTGACVITFDPRIGDTGMPFGFNYGAAKPSSGLATWRTLPSR